MHSFAAIVPTVPEISCSQTGGRTDGHTHAHGRTGLPETMIPERTKGARMTQDMLRWRREEGKQ